MEAQRRAYEFAQRVNNELESRLRDMGVNERNLSEHEVRRNVYPNGLWQFTLDGRPVLTADPQHFTIE